MRITIKVVLIISDISIFVTIEWDVLFPLSNILLTGKEVLFIHQSQNKHSIIIQGKSKIIILTQSKKNTRRQYGKNQANLAFRPRPMTSTDQNFITNGIWPVASWQNVKENDSISPNLQTSVNPKDVFGYGAQTCKNCLQTWIKFV